MELNLSELARDRYGEITAPMLLLQTRHEKTIGVLGRYFNLRFKLKYAETSEMSFEYPEQCDGEKVPHYDRLEALSIIEAKPFGTFLVTNIDEKNDGIKCTKTCTCKSIEVEFDNKRLVFGQGTYRLYDHLSPSNSIVGMILERMPTWSIGDISSELLSRYRTFDATNEYALSWLRGKAAESFDCVFAFDTIHKKINIRSRNDKARMTQIYLSFGNLIKEAKVQCVADDIFTVAAVSGADDVTIRDVNPIGTNYIYNLDYYIGRGDIPSELAQKWRDWQNTIAAQQPYFISAVSLKNAAYARYLTEKARLTNLNGQLDSIDNRRSTTLEALSNAETSADRNYFEQRLKEIADEIKSKKVEISTQEKAVEAAKKEYESFADTIADIVANTKIDGFFNKGDLVVLESYLIEGDISNSTFAVCETDIGSGNDTFSNMGTSHISFDDITLRDVKTDPSTGRRIFDISGGSIMISGDAQKQNADGSTGTTQYSLRSEINRATFDYKNQEVVFSVFLGEGVANDVSFPSGNLTVVCGASINVEDLLAGMKPDDEDNSLYIGCFTFNGSSCAVYFTRNVTEYQQYSVKQELYDYAVKQLENASSPTYEFDIDSGNFIWAQEFEPFKNEVRLGCGIYLSLYDGVTVEPILLEIDIDFENPANFSLAFANAFKRQHDGLYPLGEKIESASTISRNMDKNKLGYGLFTGSNAKDALGKFLKEGMDLSAQTVKTASDQGVTLNDTGITLESPNSSYYLRLTNGMVALMDKETEMAKVGIGHFVNSLTGQTWNGINAEVLAGAITLTKHLEVHCPKPDGETMYFKATANGVEINDGSFCVRHDRNGMILLDTPVGIAIGDNDMITVDSNGHRVFHEDHATAYLDMNGKLHLKDIDASGTIHGSVITGSEIYVGGNNTAQNCKFGVDANGNIIGIQTANGNLKFDADGKAYFGNDVNISGGLTLSGSVKWSQNSFPIQSQFAISSSGPWHTDMGSMDKWRKDKTWSGEWTLPYQFRGEDGKPGQNGSSGSDATVNRANILLAMLKATPEDGLYTTYIDGKQCLGINATAINTGILSAIKISGCDIYGGSFYDTNGKTRLELNPSSSHSGVADLILWGGGGNNPAFSIYDNMGSVSLSAYGVSILTAGQVSGGVSAHGSWDFSNANVTGVVAKFA